ncbi:hypothetical protein ALPR1_09760 [Algoriphagus machipongonensis]|uniref:Uncharacterized protein n=1 Tax=Algoriphagus machipongonensis TaxID=388413 RepID=A3HRM3_9BACT|nr:hypothetical protein ALPR1_09760 [Algoriphagus machipongonensis]
MGDHQLSEKLSVIGGLRLKHTVIDYIGNIFDIDNETVSSAETSIEKLRDLLKLYLY